MATTTGDNKMPEVCAEDKQHDNYSEEENAVGADAHYAPGDPKEARRIRRTIDFRLVLALGMMYGMSLMDRSNLPNAAIAGMRVDLSLQVSYRYSLVALSFFITYTLFQPVAVIACRYIGPRTFLCAICLAWGILILGFGFVKEWQTMVGLRVLLGLLEAGYFPGCVYVLSTWFTRYHVAKRYSVFYLTGNLCSAFSNILAYGLMQMEGLGGVRGWSWIFIMEGLITVVVAVIAYTIMVRFPDEEVAKPSWRFLTPKQIKQVMDDLNADRGDADPDPFSWAKFLKPAKDIEIWGFAFIMMLVGVVNYAFAFFLPILLRDNLGYSVGLSQILAAPPYVVSAVIMYATSWASDKWRIRAHIIVFNATISIIGLPIMGFTTNPALRLFGAFIGIAGNNANVPAAMSYQANNIRGQWRRAFCSATLTGLGGIGGVAGSLIFRSQDSPNYIPGFIAVITANVLVVVICGLMSMLFKHRNKLADQGKLVINDNHAFRYTL